MSQNKTEIWSNFCRQYMACFRAGQTYVDLSISTGINLQEVFNLKAEINHYLRSNGRKTLPLLKQEQRDSWKAALVN